MDMAHITVRGLVICLFVGSAICVLGAAAVDERRELDVVSTPAEINLGQVNPETSHPCTIVLKNVGWAAVHIGEVRTTCGCTVAKTAHQVIEPRGKTSVNVTVKTGTDSGPVVRTVYVEITNEQSTLLDIIAIPIRLTVRGQR